MFGADESDAAVIEQDAAASGVVVVERKQLRPGEVLVEVGLAIKDKAGIDKLFITSMTNDSIGYVCHAEAYAEGDYEPTRGTHLAQGAGEALITRALALLAEIQR